MYKRFTDRARKVMQFSCMEAMAFCHDAVAPVHVLIGLVREGEGVGANVLKNLRINLLPLLVELCDGLTAGPSRSMPGKLPFLPETKKVIASAMDWARTLVHNYVGTEHLLLGLLSGDEWKCFAGTGVSVETVRTEVARIVQPSAEDLAAHELWVWHSTVIKPIPEVVESPFRDRVLDLLRAEIEEAKARGKVGTACTLLRLAKTVEGWV